jgi:hypothetical protein
MSAASDFLEVEVRKAIFRTSTVTVRGDTTAYSLGDRVMLGTSDLNVYECISAGTSDSSPPAFSTTLGDSTTDGTVTWLTLAQGMPKRPLYWALFTAAPSDAGGGTEVSGGAYARVARAPLDANYSAASGTDGATDNVAAVTFPAPSGANWGVVTHFGLFDRLTGGNLLMWAALTVAKTVNDGDPAPQFSAGAIDAVIA